MSLPEVPRQSISPVAIVVLLSLATLFVVAIIKPKLIMPGTLQAYLRFIYGSFLKPHTGDSYGNQQDALESFYHSQAEAYDITRTTLLRGRDDMIELVAAQLKHKNFAHKPVWVDVSLIHSNSEHNSLNLLSSDRRRYWLEHRANGQLSERPRLFSRGLSR